jgi:hypothetical protein
MTQVSKGNKGARMKRSALCTLHSAMLAYRGKSSSDRTTEAQGLWKKEVREEAREEARGEVSEEVPLNLASLK